MTGARRGGREACRRAAAAAALVASAAMAAGVAPAGNAAPSGAPTAAAPAIDAGCPPAPLDGRALYLRGTFNGWTADEAQRFHWACDRWELVTRLPAGDAAFKVADEAWSADADFGLPPGARAPGDVAADGDDASRTATLALRGAEWKRAGAAGGTHRFTLTMADARAPRLRVEPCPAADAGAPLGATVLYARGSFNNFAAQETHALRFSCDAYYLNLDLPAGRHEFRIADAAGSTVIGPRGLGDDSGAPFVLDTTVAAGGAPARGASRTLRLAWVDGRPLLRTDAPRSADPRPRAVADPLARSLRFDSRDPAHKAPFGPVVPGTAIDFRVHAAPGVQSLTLVVERRRLEGNQERLAYEDAVRVPMRREGAVPGAAGSATDVPAEVWHARHRFDAAAVHGYWFEAVVGGRRYVLHNNAEPVPWTREKGTGGAAVVDDHPGDAALAASPVAVRRLRQTVHAADLRVPPWAADAVYYQIFPDRFRNGDARNDPRPGRDRYQDRGVEFHTRWLDRPWRPGSGDGSDDAHNNDFFGGDLAGIADRLDDIAALGANALYLTPIFQAPSNHKYDTADYRRVDPAFGTDADFDRLLREAARRGIRVVLDTSLNHTGSDSVYFDRFANHRRGGAFEGGRVRPDSPYAGWYRFDPAPADPAQPFRGWAGNRDLPELDKASPGWRDFAYRADDSVTRHWLRRGAAGWRMDVAPWVPDDFWRGWREAVKAVDPDAVTIAETWFDASKYLLGDTFDSTMNYIWRNALLDHAAGTLPATGLAAQIEHLREAYPAPALHALMNLLSSHDVPRALHVLGARDDGSGSSSSDAAAAATALAKARLRLALFWQMTLPGAPSIYYGDEVGVGGGEDPYNRATYPWPDLGGKPDFALRESMRAMVALRRAHPELRRGALGAPLHADAHVLVLTRRLDAGRWALVAGNNDPAAARRVTVTLPPGFDGAKVVDATNGETLPLERGRLTFEVPALGGRVWLAGDR